MKMRIIEHNDLYYPQERFLWIFWCYVSNWSDEDWTRLNFVKFDDAISFCTDRIKKEKKNREVNVLWESN